MASPESERFQIALELQRTGFELQRQNLRRRFPDESEADIERRFREWLLDRPPDYSPT